jgi:hypothetical protein
MIDNNIDYDKIYAEEYLAQVEEHINLVMQVVESNPNRQNHFVKQKIHTALDNLKVSLAGYRKDSSLFEDQYFKRLLSSFLRDVGNYKVNPISNFLLDEYQNLRSEAKTYPNTAKPEIYEFNDLETIKYLAKYNSLNKLFNKIIHLSWNENETADDLIKKIRDENYSEPDYIFGSFGIARNHSVANTIREETPANFSQKAHAITYYLLNQAKKPGFNLGDTFYKEYSIRNNLNESSFRTEMNRIANTIENRRGKLSTYEEARQIIANNNCEIALNTINKIIVELNNHKVR